MISPKNNKVDDHYGDLGSADDIQVSLSKGPLAAKKSV